MTTNDIFRHLPTNGNASRNLTLLVSRSLFAPLGAFGGRFAANLSNYITLGLDAPKRPQARLYGFSNTNAFDKTPPLSFRVSVGEGRYACFAFDSLAGQRNTGAGKHCVTFAIQRNTNVIQFVLRRNVFLHSTRYVAFLKNMAKEQISAKIAPELRTKLDNSGESNTAIIEAALRLYFDKNTDTRPAEHGETQSKPAPVTHNTDAVERYNALRQKYGATFRRAQRLETLLESERALLERERTLHAEHIADLRAQTAEAIESRRRADALLNQTIKLLSETYVTPKYAAEITAWEHSPAPPVPPVKAELKAGIATFHVSVATANGATFVRRLR